MDLLSLKLALIAFSGIITTILGKTATNTKGAGRDKRVHHSKSLPLPITGEGLFFSLRFHSYYSYKMHINQSYTIVQIWNDLFGIATTGLVQNANHGVRR
jgi:hypothetical protein